MFFTVELLQKRDSGFGLLWLAATLGSQSVFKKLPKRSVMSADIPELCDAIAEPKEPLALRLSSNLMVGVVRVYKVKQELLMNDITTCSNSLRRMLQDILSPTSNAANLQMAQPTLRSGAVTLTEDPKAAFALEFDNLIADWDEYLNVGDKRQVPDDEDDGDDDEFNPKAKRAKGKGKQKAMLPPSSTEKPRADAHILQEFHAHLLSNSQDVSFNGSAGVGTSFSLADDNFGFNDNGFGLDDSGLDLGALGDDLLRELGEGWGAPAPPESRALSIERGLEPLIDQHLEVMDIDYGGALGDEAFPPASEGQTGNVTPLKRKQQDDHIYPAQDSAPLAKRIPSPTSSFTKQFLSQGDLQPFADITNAPPRPTKKAKRTKLLMDARIELTDEELKLSRAHYLEEQVQLGAEMRQKQAEKESSKILEEMIWGVPQGMNAPTLINFWKEIYQAQIEPPSGKVQQSQGPTASRFQSANPQETPIASTNGDLGGMQDFNMDIDMGVGANFDVDGAMFSYDPGHRRSSEDPEIGRRASRPASVVPSDIAFNLGQLDSGSQTKKFELMFPWDNAIGTSSGGGSFSPLGQNIEVDGDVRLRGSSPSKGSFSQPGSIGGLSPGPLLRHQSNGVEEFEFEVPASAPGSGHESLGSSLNVATLEKNSSNFLEYARMQYQTLQTGTAPGAPAQLTFGHIAPTDTCTRHVAAAAFYHCLMLATKDLIHVRQEEAYGPMSLNIL